MGAEHGSQGHGHGSRAARLPLDQLLGRRFEDVLKAAKLEAEGYTPRDLRATFAWHLVSVGRPLAEVGDLPGHADAGAIASKHYACYRRGAVPMDLGPMRAPRRSARANHRGGHRPTLAR
jgi:integrase